MKIAALLFTTLLALHCQAIVYFKTDNPMSFELRAKIELILEEKCPKAFGISGELFEENTTVTKVDYDSRSVDYFYSSLFTPGQITVKSAQYSANSPNPEMFIEVQSLHSEENLCQALSN